MELFGRGRSKLDRGIEAFSRRHWRQARRLLEQSVREEGRASGDYHLGLMYRCGLGGERDLGAAAACFARAADKGHAGAQTAYGVALRCGLGAPKDDDAARALFRAAAAADDPRAMMQLASMSPPGDARRLLTRASEQGHAPAMRRLGEMLLAEAPVEALAWLYAAAALTGEEAGRERAAKLARELSAGEIDAAHKAGRARVEHVERQARERA